MLAAALCLAGSFAGSLAGCGGQTATATGAASPAPSAAPDDGPDADGPAPLDDDRLEPTPTPTVELYATPAAKSSPKEPARSPADIERVIQANQKHFAACYRLHPAPRPEGYLKVSWVVNLEGKVFETKQDVLGSSILDDGVTQCVLKRLGRIDFGESPGGFQSRVTYTFHFRRQDR